jgi:hypothetical protein
MRINVYQVNEDSDKRNLIFRDYETAVEKGGVDPSEYKCVFRGDVEGKDLDSIFWVLNNFDHPYLGTYQGRSLSTSDVVEVIGDIPEIYGKIDFLYADKNNVGRVGETVYYTDPEKYNKEIEECRQFNSPIVAENLSEKHVRLVEPGIYFCNSVGWEKIDFDTTKCAPMDGVKTLMILPGKSPVLTNVDDDYRLWQKAVSFKGEDSLMEVTYPFDDSAVVVGNEEAKLIGMEGNRHVGSSVYAGPIYIVNDTGYGEFCDLTDAQIEKYSKMFEQPESISPEEVQRDCGFTITGFEW